MITIKKDITVTDEFDAVVCGGGPSGFIAAVAASRNGAKTALIERYGYLGGTATAGLVTPMANFRKNGKLIINGIPWEFVQRLTATNSAVDTFANGSVPFDQEFYKLEAQRMVVESGAKLFLHSYITDVIKEKNRITHIVFANKSGQSAISAKTVIDCTGDADVAFMADVPMEEYDAGTLQPMTLWIRLGGVDPDFLESDDEAGSENKRHFSKEIHNMLLEKTENERIPNFGGPWFFKSMANGIVDVNISRCMADSSNAESLTKAEIKLREDVFALVNALKKYHPAFRNCYILQTASQAGSRESRRIIGSHKVTKEEILNGIHYPDSIGMGGHCIDIHVPNSAEQQVRFLDKPYYIPYGCMITKEIDNLIVAGRCVSMEREVLASMRVQACCMAEGQAAGTAAAIACKNDFNVRNIDIDFLRKTLSEQKAVV